MGNRSAIATISDENAQLKKELANALEALRMMRERLIESQEDLRKTRWLLEAAMR